MRLYTVLLYFCRQLYMFRMIPSSIIRSTFKLELQHMALVEPYLLPSADVEESELGLLYFLQTAVHVSYDTIIHHQEHIQTVITKSGIGRTVFATVL